MDIASTLKLTAKTNDRELTAALSKKYGIKIDEKVRSTFADPANDQRLKEAEQTNRIDQAYLELAGSQLKTLNQQIAQTFQQTQDGELRQLLDDIYKSNQVVLEAIEKV